MICAFDSSAFSEQKVRDTFRRLGFVVIRRVLNQYEVGLVRSQLDRAFSEPDLRDLPTMCSTELLRHEPVWQPLFKHSVVNSLQAALGPSLCYQNDLDVQRNSYGQTGLQRHSGWHMDAGSETGNGYLRAEDYRFAKCGIFLQDFDNGWGGGIRVKIASHRALSEVNPVKRGWFFSRRVINRIAMMLRADVGTFRVPTRAGDLCFFDSRLLHSSVLPSPENIRRIGYDRKPDVSSFWAQIPREHTKYVVYWDACNAAMSSDFMRNSVKRAETEMPGLSEQRFTRAVYTRVLSVKYPEDFPQGFVTAARDRGISIASMDEERCRFYKRKLQSMQLLHP